MLAPTRHSKPSARASSRRAKASDGTATPLASTACSFIAECPLLGVCHLPLDAMLQVSDLRAMPRVRTPETGHTSGNITYVQRRHGGLCGTPDQARPARSSWAHNPEVTGFEPVTSGL